jgi:hypothetical protein
MIKSMRIIIKDDGDDQGATKPEVTTTTAETTKAIIKKEVTKADSSRAPGEDRTSDDATDSDSDSGESLSSNSIIREAYAVIKGRSVSQKRQVHELGMGTSTSRSQ